LELSFRSNPPDRCYHCKTDLYTKINQFIAEHRYNAAVNVRAGVRYMAQLWRQFATISYFQLNSVNPWARSDVKKAIAAYNAGPGAVKKYGDVPPYRETQGYVVKVLQSYVRYRRMFPSAAA